MKGETHTQVVRLYISNVEARVWATHLFGGWLIPCLLLKFWSRDSKIVKTLCNAPINVKPVGGGGGRACGGDLTFFKNLQSNSLLTGKSFQSNATKFPHPALHISVKYRKIPKIIPRAYIFQRPFLRGLFLEGPIFGGAYVRREICVSKSIGLAYSWKEIYRFCFVLLCIWGQFS